MGIFPFHGRKRKKRRSSPWRDILSDWRFRALSLLLSASIAASAYLGLFTSLARGAGLGELLDNISGIIFAHSGKPRPPVRKPLAKRARSASVVRGRARVVDGDSIRINGVNVRLHGIDAPELFQTCQNRFGRRYECGERAREHLRNLVGNGRVRCRRVTTDRYGRMVATCRVGGMDIGQRMVRDGWAVAFVRYSRRYVSDERAARLARRGLWAGRFVPPSLWRRMKKRH